jgi:lipopolysaccharide export system permease protein
MPQFTGKNSFVIFGFTVVWQLVIISRYLIKEVLASLSAVTVVLLLIFLSNRLVRYLSYAASGKIAANVVLQLLGFEIPYLLALLLPLGLYLGIMLAYGRLYADSEMPVMNASGMGVKKLVSITSIVAVAVSALVLVLMLWINPLIAQQKGKELAQNNLLDTLRPGRFQVINGGRRVVYLEKISRDHPRADNLFIAEEQKNSEPDANRNWTVVSADHGYQQKDQQTHEDFMISTDGYRYAGTPGENAFKIIQFEKYAVRIPVASTSNVHEEEEAIATSKLWHDYHNPYSAAELQWRFALPISVLLLALLAIPLAQVRPRQGRYSHILPAILIYIVYVNLLFIARNWMEQKIALGALGITWVHAIILTFALMLLIIQRHYQLKPFPFFKWMRKPA